MTIFWTDNQGKLIKSTDDSQVIEGLTKVTIAPNSSKDIWNGSQWTTLLNDYKEDKIKLNQLEAGIRIAALFGETDVEKLKIKQLNALANAVDLTEKKASGGTLTTEEQAELDTLRNLNIQKDAIRTAENDAANSINNATTIAEIDAITVNWP